MNDEMIGPPVWSVHEALSLVMRDVQAVGKDGRNTSQNFSFRGVDAVVNAVGPALRDHGVIVLPTVTDKTYSTYETRNGALMHQCLLTVEYTFVGPDGSTLTCSAPGESADSGDKATAKAMSVAYRTALLQALCIPTDEPDPDETTVERAAPEPVDPEAAARKAAWRALRVEVAALHGEKDDDEQKTIAQAAWDAHGKDPKNLTAMIAGVKA